uniref:Nucleotide-diphospho-sugar transferase domain-containing protein n=1 Tax=viral metagenome TaxID=1070528 RepID=A0A6C0CPK0_9ZZZZ
MDQTKTKNCVYALTRGYTNTSRYESLLKRNKYIEENVVCGDYHVDHILFHEGNITKEHQDYIQSDTSLKLTFIDIKTTTPRAAFSHEGKEIYTNNKGHLMSSLFDERTIRVGCQNNERPWGLNYRYMCEFHFVYVLEYLKGYKYAMRIDEDCYMHNKINYFDLLHNTNQKLISGWFFTDGAQAVLGMKEFSKKFIQENNVKNGVLHKQTMGPYTNVLLLDVEHFSENELVRKYMNEVRENNFIIKYRWGDLPLWGQICFIFLDRNQYNLNNKAIQYFHGSHSQKVNI